MVLTYTFQNEGDDSTIPKSFHEFVLFVHRTNETAHYRLGNPIGFDATKDQVSWLKEKYGLRSRDSKDFPQRFVRDAIRKLPLYNKEEDKLICNTDEDWNELLSAIQQALGVLETVWRKYKIPSLEAMCRNILKDPKVLVDNILRGLQRPEQEREQVCGMMEVLKIKRSLSPPLQTLSPPLQTLFSS
jgi:hypothetical protein